MNAMKIRMNRQRLYIPVTNFAGLNVTTGPVWSSLITPASVIGGIAAIGISGLIMEPAAHVRHGMRIPSDWDLDHKIRARVWWAAAGAGNVTWILLYNSVGDGDAISSVAGALNTPLVADTRSGASVMERTEWGVINGKSIPVTDEFIAFDVEQDADTVTGNVYLVGLEFEYTPKLAPGFQDEAQAWANR